MWEVSVKLDFSAAHQLRDYVGKCEHLHGHNWNVLIVVQCVRVDRLGMTMDFNLLRSKARDVLNELDHKFLNDVKPFDTENPSAENIARFIFERLARKVNSDNCTLKKVAVFETPNTSASYMED